MTAEAILVEIVLFPTIKSGIKRHGKILLDGTPGRLGETMQLNDFFERGLVEGATHEPAFTAITPKIVLSEIFDPDQAFHGIVKINPGRTNAVLGEKLRDPDVVPVLFALEAVLHQ